jgi:hypothetical protein
MKLRSTQGLRVPTLALALAFCALAMLPVANAKAVKLLMSWKNPRCSGPKPHRILVIGMSENPQIRADFEDDFSSAIASDSLEAVPGNSILLRPHSADLDADYLRGQIRDHKIDAVLVSRLVSIDKNTIYTPGHSNAIPYDYYRRLYGYYGTDHAARSEPAGTADPDPPRPPTSTGASTAVAFARDDACVARRTC